MTASVQERFDALYRKTFGRFADRIGRQIRDRETGEDIVAQAFIRVWQDIEGGFDGDVGLAVNTVLADLVKNHWRTVERRRESPVGLIPELDELYKGLSADQELAQVRPQDTDDRLFTTDFDRAVRALPEDERDAFILTELRGLTVREAGPVLGLGKSETADRAKAARNFIREELT